MVIEARWRFSANNEHIATRLENWGAQVHFLFGSALAVAGGALLPMLAGLSPNGRVCAISVILAIVLGISGLIHDRRLMFVDGRFAGYASEEV
jgi:hypothetical protein